jgi:hypothetical protein
MWKEKVTFIQDDFVSEDNNIELSIFYQTVQDISAWLATCFDV